MVSSVRRQRRQRMNSKATGQAPKTVHFDEHYEHVKFIETSFTQEEKPTLWYSKNDLLEIRNGQSSACTCLPIEDDDNKKVVVVVNNCNCKAERQRQHEFVVSLLRQQQEHKLMGVEDPKGLFQFSRACSKKSRQKALQCAKEQAQEVKSFEQMRQETLSVVDDALQLLEL